mgnify:CR=1 FL=1
MILSNDDKCWCKSGLKYKECHLEFDKKLQTFKKRCCIVPKKKLIKNKEQIEGIRKSAKINNGILDLVSEKIKEGMTTEDINKIGRASCRERVS